MLNLFEEFFAITQVFEEYNIRYAVIGGFAMAFHDTLRATRDIDFLVLLESIDDISSAIEELGYRSSGTPFILQGTELTLHRFVKFFGSRHAVLDFLLGENERYRQIIQQAIIMDAGLGPVRIARKDDLIYLKSMRNSEQDKLDIKQLRKNDKSGSGSQGIE